MPALLKKLGIEPGEEIYLGAFSAGGSAVKLLLQHPDDRAAIRAVMLADATYELRGSDGRAGVSAPLVSYAVEALADGSRMFVATASSAPNNRLGVAEPSGTQTLERLAAEIERQSGARFDLKSHVDGVQGRTAARVWSRGSVVLADFGGELKHEEHATQLAPRMWREVLAPWIAVRAARIEPAAPAPQARGEATGLLVGLGAVTVIALGIAALDGRAERRWRRHGR